ncbi:MAG: hypothetical protein ACTIA6_05310 [Pseudoclavibacter sp.]
MSALPVVDLASMAGVHNHNRQDVVFDAIQHAVAPSGRTKIR